MYSHNHCVITSFYWGAGMTPHPTSAFLSLEPPNIYILYTLEHTDQMMIMVYVSSFYQAVFMPREDQKAVAQYTWELQIEGPCKLWSAPGHHVQTFKRSSRLQCSIESRKY